LELGQNLWSSAGERRFPKGLRPHLQVEESLSAGQAQQAPLSLACAEPWSFVASSSSHRTDQRHAPACSHAAVVVRERTRGWENGRGERVKYATVG